MNRLSYSGDKGVPSQKHNLIDYVYKNDTENVKICLQNDVMAWNTRDVNGMTPLMVAATLNRLEIVTLLIDGKCDVNATDESGNTALHLAVDEGNTEVVRQLVRSGRCVLDALNCAGDTALMRAAFYDYSESASILLKNGFANPDIRNQLGQTALLVALQEGSHVTASVLLSAGCDVMISDDLGRSALFMAIHSPLIKTLDIAKSILEHDYNINVDRIWLLNEEKHNLFYQDDDFYQSLRRQLRSLSTDDARDDNPRGLKTSYTNNDSRRANTTHKEFVSTDMIHSPLSAPPQTFAMSPTVKEIIMASPISPKFPPIPFSKTNTLELLLKPTHCSPLHARRTMSRTTNGLKLKSTNLDTTKDAPCLLQSREERAAHNLVTSREHSTSSNLVRPYGHMRPLNLVTSCEQMTSSNIVASREPFMTETENASNQKFMNMVEIYPTRQKFLKCLNEDNREKEKLPGTNFRRQLSVQGNCQIDAKPRKISLPAKPFVRFCTDIQIFEVK